MAATDDFSKVTAAYDKPAYNKGDVMKLSISGKDSHVEAVQTQAGPLSLTIGSATGAQETITAPAVTITQNVASDVIVAIVKIVDASGRVWTVAADGLSATAIA